MKTLIVVLLALVLIVAVPFTVFADGRGCSHHGYNGHSCGWGHACSTGNPGGHGGSHCTGSTGGTGGTGGNGDTGGNGKTTGGGVPKTE